MLNRAFQHGSKIQSFVSLKKRQDKLNCQLKMQFIPVIPTDFNIYIKFTINKRLVITQTGNF